MTNKALYLIIGALLGIIAILTVEKSLFNNDIFAVPDKGSETSANNNYIAIGSMSRTDNNLLWLIDTSNKKLLLYEYFQESVIRLKAARDIQYDVRIPDGITMPASTSDLKMSEPVPSRVKEMYGEYWDALDKLGKKNSKKPPK